MRVRFLVFGWGSASGGVRSVVNQANALADHHQVELVAVFKRRKVPFPLHPSITCRTLIPKKALKRMVFAELARRPSRYVPRAENRYASFSLATDLMVRRYLNGLRGGVLITTRPALNILAARFAPRSVVRIGEDHMNFRSYKPELAEEIRRWYPKLDAVTVLTRPDVAEYTRALGPAARVEHVPNMVPSTEHAPAPLENKVIMAAGRLTHQKGFDMLVDAFAKVSPAHPDWSLRIYGRGTLHERLGARISQRNLDGRVRLMGSTNAFDSALRDASFYVLSSRYEGLPMTILESMTQGVPVVAYDCHTGPRDVITHERDGLLVPPNDVDALASSITEMIEQPERRRQLGVDAYESVRRFHPASVGERWDELFTELGADVASGPGLPRLVTV